MERIIIIITLTICAWILPAKAFSQTNKIKGIVMDNITKKPLPFVNIVFNKNKQGLSSDIDGSFEINTLNNVEFLQFSYVGYSSKILAMSNIGDDELLVVKLEPKTFDINEITVFPGENPAHRIINKVIENRKINNPENLSSFSYKAYHKMVLTFDMDKAIKEAKNNSLDIDSLAKDSSYIKAKKMLDSMYLFMVESVSERKFKKPGKVKEKVIATKVSGLKQASLFVLATQLQSLSFYDKMITIADSRYVNPISKGSTNRYFFNIEDTTYSQRGDTVFIISYKPKKKKNFEALKGILSISTYKYAVKNVIAKPVSENGLISVEIQQKYDLINNKYWFPAELNTNMIVNSVSAQAGELRMNSVLVAKSYISDIEVNTIISNKEFTIAELEVADDALTKDPTFWANNRKDSLSRKELTTYKVIDSIGKKHNLDLKVKVAQTVAKGYIPIKFLDVALNSLFNYNMFEKLRLGIGLKTNNKISSAFSLGGYFAYGFNDKKIKYGGNLLFNIYKKRDIKLGFEYKNDVIESSGYSFLETQSINSTEMYRDYFVKDMTYNEGYSVNFQAMLLKHLKTRLSTTMQTMHTPTDYMFNNEQNAEVSKKHNFFETALQFRYAPNEELAYIENEFYAVTSFSSPVFMGNIIKGFNNFNGNYDYLKLEAKLYVSMLTKAFGKTNLQVIGGKIWGNLPYYKLYNGHGSYYDFNTEAAYSFATMRMNEFLSDQFFAVYLRQDFGSLLFKTKKFKPKVILVSSLTYGSLNNIGLHNNISIKTMEKGYFESGVLINSIFRQLKFIGYGFGIFYRYGNYTFKNNKENFAYRITITFDL